MKKLIFCLIVINLINCMKIEHSCNHTKNYYNGNRLEKFLGTTKKLHKITASLSVYLKVCRVFGNFIVWLQVHFPKNLPNNTCLKASTSHFKTRFWGIATKIALKLFLRLTLQVSK